MVGKAQREQVVVFITSKKHLEIGATDSCYFLEHIHFSLAPGPIKLVIMCDDVAYSEETILSLPPPELFSLAKPQGQNPRLTVVCQGTITAALA